MYVDGPSYLPFVRPSTFREKANPKENNLPCRIRFVGEFGKFIRRSTMSNWPAGKLAVSEERTDAWRRRRIE
eukprot:6506802-Prymnesium_polylepis.1